ncbi:MAG: hypothetical protein WCG51_05560 [Elusimicrobiota bacterium]
MQTIKRFICLSITATLLSATVIAAETPVFFRGVRPLGMGGAFVALSDDQNAIFYNPAGLTQRQGSQFVAFEIPINISEDVLNFYNFYQDNKTDLENFDKLTNQKKIDLLNVINDRITTYRPRVRVGLPNTSYLTGNKNITWGAGIFAQAEIGFQFNRSLIIPSISVFGNIDAVAAIPLAHQFNSVPYLPGKASIGTTLKAISRNKIEELNKSVLEFQNFNPQLQSGDGYGMDLGAMYQPTTRWNLGLQITDVGGTTIKYDKVTASKAGQLDKAAYTGMINSQWNTGVAYIPSKIAYWPGKAINTHDRIVFVGDIRDILNTDERLFDDTGWKKVHMGAEMRFGPISVRGGFNSGYPTFGGGLRVPYLGLRADYAYWADETGRFAGQLPEWNHQITLALSWGDAKGRAYGNDVKSEEDVVVKKATKPVPVKNISPAPAVDLIAPTTGQILVPPMSVTNPVTSTTVTPVMPVVSPVTPVVPVAPAAVVPVQSPATATTPAVVPAITPAPPVAKPAAALPDKLSVPSAKKK